MYNIANMYIMAGNVSLLKAWHPDKTQVRVVIHADWQVRTLLHPASKMAMANLWSIKLRLIIRIILCSSGRLSKAHCLGPVGASLLFTIWLFHGLEQRGVEGVCQGGEGVWLAVMKCLGAVEKQPFEARPLVA